MFGNIQLRSLNSKNQQTNATYSYRNKNEHALLNSHEFFAGDVEMGKTRVLSTICGKTASFGKGAEILRSDAMVKMRHTCPVRDDEKKNVAIRLVDR